MTTPVQSSNRRKAGVAAIVGSAVLLATTQLTAPSEGFAAKPYWDPAHIRSYCFGETTHVQERAYGRAECEILLEQRMARDYAPAIERCLPTLVDERRVKIFAAFLDAAYNAGAPRVCSSRMARAVRSGFSLSYVCTLFDGWFTTALNRKTGKRIQLRGLELRRQREMKLCLQGAREATVG